MYLSQGFLEIEVLVLFLGRDANVAAWGQAPIVGLDLGSVHELDQALHVTQVSVWKTAREPVRLPPEVAYLFELVDRVVACSVGGLTSASDFGADPGVARARVALLLARVDEARGELVK